MKNNYYNKISVNEDNIVIYLYGDIGDYQGTVGSQEIISELATANEKKKSVDVRINSNGGEVYAGIAIFNALRQCKADVNIYIDGVAASIASIIALCGRRVKMSRYSRLMIHCVSGNCSGSIKDMQRCIQEMENIEDTLCKIYSEKCNLPKEEIKSMYFDGVDHWISADEALKLGFIDGIYDTDVIPQDLTNKGIYDTFNKNFVSKALLDVGEKADFVSFKAELCLLLGLPIDSDKESLFKAIKQITKGKKNTEKEEIIKDAINRGWINRNHQGIFMALAINNAKAFDNYIEDFKVNEKIEIENILLKARRKGKILAMENDIFLNFGLKMGAKALADILKCKPSLRLVNRWINRDKEDRSKWSFDDWRTYAPEELEKNPYLYEKLRNETGEEYLPTLEWYRKNDPDYLKRNPDVYKELIKTEFNK